MKSLNKAKYKVTKKLSLVKHNVVQRLLRKQSQSTWKFSLLRLFARDSENGPDDVHELERDTFFGLYEAHRRVWLPKL